MVCILTPLFGLILSPIAFGWKHVQCFCLGRLFLIASLPGCDPLVFSGLVWVSFCIMVKEWSEINPGMAWHGMAWHVDVVVLV